MVFTHPRVVDVAGGIGHFIFTVANILANTQTICGLASPTQAGLNEQIPALIVDPRLDLLHLHSRT